MPRHGGAIASAVGSQSPHRIRFAGNRAGHSTATMSSAITVTDADPLCSTSTCSVSHAHCCVSTDLTWSSFGSCLPQDTSSMQDVRTLAASPRPSGDTIVLSIENPRVAASPAPAPCSPRRSIIRRYRIEGADGLYCDKAGQRADRCPGRHFGSREPSCDRTKRHRLGAHQDSDRSYPGVRSRQSALRWSSTRQFRPRSYLSDPADNRPALRLTLPGSRRRAR